MPSPTVLVVDDEQLIRWSLVSRLTDEGYRMLEAGTAAIKFAPKLRALGHEVRVLDHTSGLHAIVRTPHGWIGGADPRREGVVRGE